MTERVRAEAALRDSESLRRGTLDASAHIAVIDAEGRIVLANRAYREFASRNAGSLELVAEGANYLATCHDASLRGSLDSQAFELGLREVLDGRRPIFVHEYACHSPDEQRWFVGRAPPVQVATDSRLWAVIAHENVTERELAELDLQRRLEFESLTAGIAARFVGVTHDDAFVEVESALGRLLENLELGRASFWRRPEGQPRVMRLECQARRDESLGMPVGLDTGVALPWVVERLEPFAGPSSSTISARCRPRPSATDSRSRRSGSGRAWSCLTSPLQPTMKTILMTGYAAESFPSEPGARTGHTRRFEKPVPLATLAKTIRSVLGETDERG